MLRPSTMQVVQAAYCAIPCLVAENARQDFLCSFMLFLLFLALKSFMLFLLFLALKSLRIQECCMAVS